MEILQATRDGNLGYGSADLTDRLNRPIHTGRSPCAGSLISQGSTARLDPSFCRRTESVGFVGLQVF